VASPEGHSGSASSPGGYLSVAGGRAHRTGPPCCMACWAAPVPLDVVHQSHLNSPLPVFCGWPRTLPRSSGISCRVVDAVQLKRIPLFSERLGRGAEAGRGLRQSKEVPEGRWSSRRAASRGELLAIEDGTARSLGRDSTSPTSAPATSSARPECSTTRMRAPPHRDLEDETDQPRPLEVKRLKKNAPGVYGSIEQLVRSAPATM